MRDLVKRKRIMQRSIALGHCICNPKIPCPCPIFKERDVCSCAGERPELPDADVKLTSLVEKSGCASKINQTDLKLVLAGLQQIEDPRVLVGTNTCDDAGVYLLDENTALVQTVDVFSPNVDDPYTFGQIAAANSLSDVYAMGGKPITALTVIGFPIETVTPSAMTQMLKGGQDKMTEAGVAVVGGHSINDPEPKFGYAITGVIDPKRIVTNAGAEVGDFLVLTKPLGVGAISFAAQLGRASEEALAKAGAQMATLNRAAAEAMQEAGVHAATDVTGFGLLGHLAEMVRQSGVTAELFAASAPVLSEALEYLRAGMVSGAVERNWESVNAILDGVAEIEEPILQALCDPQTSGGLLMAVPPENMDSLLADFKSRGVLGAIIGRIAEPSSGRISLRTGEFRYSATNESSEVEDMAQESGDCCCSQVQPECCASGASGTASDAMPKFSEFTKAATADSVIPLRTKELIMIALSIVSKCEPCVKIHLGKARTMGISEPEIAEAVALAVMFGGAPAMMFYDSVKG